MHTRWQMETHGVVELFVSCHSSFYFSVIHVGGRSSPKTWCQIIIHPTCRKIPTNLESTQTWSPYDTHGPCTPSNSGFPARRLASWWQKTVVEAMEKYQTKTWLVVYLPSWELTYPLSRHFWVDDVPFFHHVGFLVFRQLSIFGLTCNHFRFIHLHTKPTGTASRLVFPAGMNEWMTV